MPPSSSPKVLQAAVQATGNGSVYRGDTYRKVVMQVTGITTATITFECSVDGTNWVGILAAPPSTGTGALTLAANGVVTMDAYPYLRARISAWTSGAITVVAAGMP